MYLFKHKRYEKSIVFFPIPLTEVMRLWYK